MTIIIRLKQRLYNEDGFALITTLLILALLTVVGTAAIETTSFELKIAGNERLVQERFYIADSGWTQTGPHLNALASAPDFVNLSLLPGNTTVRNYGDGTDSVLNDTFTVNPDGIINGTSYWYRINYEQVYSVTKFGPGYQEFEYSVDCTANGEAEVATIVRKIYQVGY
ncbi:MAG: PilX N-terminal domain-containing pilus assembly protein [Desulfobacterales bacterium]|nr:PilX N-terminal domain-containing pilus assembly protein [Desulfobacterales bacterium]